MMHWGDIAHADQPQRRPTPKIVIEREETQRYIAVPIIARETRKFSASKPDISLAAMLEEAEIAARQRSHSYPLLGPDAQCVAEKWRELAMKAKDVEAGPMEKYCKITIINSSKSQPNVSLSSNTF